MHCTSITYTHIYPTLLEQVGGGGGGGGGGAIWQPFFCFERHMVLPGHPIIASCFETIEFEMAAMSVKRSYIGLT